jgi:hypothetical protein
VVAQMSSGNQLDPKYAAVSQEITKVINVDCGGSKDQFISYV